MALTNYEIGGTSAHKGGTQTIQLQDGAERNRYYVLSQYMEGVTGANGFTAARTGVITAGTLDNTTNIPNALQISAAGSGLDVNIAKGAGIIERTLSLNGTYRVVSYATGKVTLGTADPTNDRMDGIYLQVFDGLVGDNGGASLTQFVVVPGSGAPVAGVIPLAPAPPNSIMLGHIKLTHGAATVTAAMVFDDRKSTALKGSIRVLLPGDSLADAGTAVGELRNTIAITNQPTIDWWSTTGSAWVRLFELAPPAEKFNAVAGGLVGTTSTAYVDAVPVSGGVCGTTFVAPASGSVGIDWSAAMRSSALTLQAVMSPHVRTGGVLGSGSDTLAASDNQSIKSNAQTTTTTVTGFHELTGLTPGSTYNVVLQWKVSSAGSANGDSPRVRVTPRPN